MLEANPTFLGDETAAELIKVFSTSSYVEGAAYRRDQLR